MVTLCPPMSGIATWMQIMLHPGLSLLLYHVGAQGATKYYIKHPLTLVVPVTLILEASWPFHSALHL